MFNTDMAALAYGLAYTLFKASSELIVDRGLKNLKTEVPQFWISTVS